MKKSLIVVLLLFAFLQIFSQNFESPEIPEFDFYTRGPYRKEVPTPQKLLRYDIGKFHTTYAQMETVINAIAKAASDRVRIFELGLTNEYRMIYLIAISSPENLARLDEIKANNARLTDPRKTSPKEAENIINSNPLIVWLAYTIHGNESASFEAMMQVVYQLAASEEPATLEILKNLVVLIIPCQNPDGHERFVTWYNSVAMGNADKNALEHREPWSIFGRYNHYRFDLNRDNIAATQVETQILQKAFFEWNPQVVADHHGQPSQYFFPPAALPINPNLPQPVTDKWMDIFGRANAASFDLQKWDYYVRDVFDLFYPGYWDSFPSLNGATGMTYETDGGGFKGLRWTRDDGSIITLRSAIAKHFVASMTTLETASKYTRERLRDFYEFRRSAIEEVKAEKIKRIIVLPQKDRVKTAELMETLKKMRIEIGILRQPFTSKLAHSYRQKNSPAETVNFPAGAYVIELNQPQKRLIKALLEPDTPQNKEFIDEQVARFRRNQMRGKQQPKEEYAFYDITAWSLPLAFGVDAYWTEDAVPISTEPLTDEYLNAVKTGSVSGRAQIAYVFPYDTDSAPIMALRLLNEGFRVNVATRQINAGGKMWKPGTFVVRVTRNSEKVHEAVSRLARELGVNVTAVNTGYFDSGDTGVGSEALVALEKPKIAMLGDEGVDQTSFGSVWWIFDKYKLEFTALSFAAIRSGALKNYDILILPDGSPDRYFASLGKSGVENLKDWIQRGGTLITIRGASVFTTLKDVALTTSSLVGTEEEKPAEEKKTPETKSEEPSQTDKQNILLPPVLSPSASMNKIPEVVPGAIMRATADLTTYFNYGLEEEFLPVLLSSGYFFRLSKEGTNAIIFDRTPKKTLTISGFTWEGNTEELLRGTAYMIVEHRGQGNVVIFAEEPFFRGFFRSMTRPFFNAILFRKGF
ncbi:MAG: M14 family zinc carboxypeptidase [Pyrinomonadaceae bacterium]|nr:M14 family zinc carboxypeptidase [Pyrinomonadaceae bacterium]MCX7640748.1 M14 family zinc carboxypeptidase [Pyrinomonadaceae bacterium]MDW8304643.1 M14 family zinc carboxypeptidase [Acidobacteriota bacterium]